MTRNTVNRRTVLKTASFGTITGIAGCTNFGSDDNESVSVGVIAPQAGVYEFLGTDMEYGAKLFETKMNENGGVLGNDLEVVVRNGEGDPEQSVNAARQLLERDDVDFLMGNASTSAALAVSEYAAGQEVLYNIVQSASTSMTSGSECNRYTFKNSPTTQTVGKLGAEWMVDNVGTDVFIIFPEYSYGRAVRDAWESYTTESGGNVVEIASAPLGEDNFSGIIGQIKDSDADVLVQGFAGSDGIAFYQQAESEGLTDTPMIAPALLQPTGAAVPQSVIDAVDIYGMLYYDRGIDTEQNQTFVQDFTDEYGAVPATSGAYVYVNLQMLVQAIESVGSNNTEDIIDEYEQLSMDTIVGTTAQRACDHQGASPVVIGHLQGSETVADAEVPVYDYVATGEGEDLLMPCSEVECNM